MYGVRLFGTENPFYGKHHSEETKKKMRGRKNSPATLKKMSENRKGIPSWRKDIPNENVGYYGVHAWVRNRKPKPDLCERCNIAPPFDLANKTGKYLRDLDDWEYLCRKCHQISDGRASRRDPITGQFKRL